jgi:hypothetical protein
MGLFQVHRAPAHLDRARHRLQQLLHLTRVRRHRTRLRPGHTLVLRSLPVPLLALRHLPRRRRGTLPSPALADIAVQVLRGCLLETRIENPVAEAPSVSQKGQCRVPVWMRGLDHEDAKRTKTVRSLFI